MLEMLTEQKSAAQASREYGIKDSVLSRWKQEFIERAPLLFEVADPGTGGQEQRIAELERMIGRLAMELEMAKKVSRFLGSPVQQKREIARMLKQENSYPVGTACELLGLPRSTFYYQPVLADESQLETAIDEIAGQYPTYGTRRVTHQLRRTPYQMQVNRKRVHRIMLQKELLRPVKRRKKRTTDSEHPYPRYPNLVKDLEVVRPDQVWASDITYVRLKQDFVYLAIILDVFTRAIRGWRLSRLLDQELSLTALRKALQTGQPDIHHSDQGVQYAAYAYIDLLKVHAVQISMAAVGKAEENGYAERWMRTIKEEEVDLSEYLDFMDALDQIGHFIDDVYMTKRIHSSLGYLTPVEFETAWWVSHLAEASP